MYRSTSTVVGGEWSASCPGKEWYPLDRRLDGLQNWPDDAERKILPLSGLELQPLSCRACSQLLYQSLSRHPLFLQYETVYTWLSTYDWLLFWLTGCKSIWSYVGHIFINSIFNLFIIFIHVNNNFSILWMGPCHCLVKIVDLIGVLSSTSWFIINLVIYLFFFFFVVVSAAGFKSHRS
jgi:hypothetical protein